MVLIIFVAACTIVLIGINLLNFITKIPNKSTAIYFMIYGLVLGVLCINSYNQISILGIVIGIIIYSIYVLMYVYVLDIVNRIDLYQIIKLHKDMKLDAICVMIGYTVFTNFFIVITVVFFKRYNEVNNFNDFSHYIYFIVASASMLIECLFLIVSLIRLCYKTKFEISIFKQYFLLVYLVIICIILFAILNTSLNCIDFAQEKVIIQNDCFIDYIYHYTCIFTLQYNSSDNLPQIDKILNVIALIYSYTFITTIVSLTINSFNTKKEKIEYIPKCPICGSTNINKITLISKMIKTNAFGTIGAIDDAGKTYRCGNCGSKF